MLGAISKNDIDRAWRICSPLLDKSLRKGDGDYTLEDIKKGLKEGGFQLWAWAEEDRIICCGVTGIVIYPQKKVCAVMMVGGQGLRLWRNEAQDIIADWARKNGCSDLEGYVRKGWLRVLLPQWRVLWTTVRRKL